MPYRLILLVFLIVLPSLNSGRLAAADRLPESAKRILFLGDSITFAGHYIALLETQLRLQTKNPDHFPDIINLGLPSETCSGLSEPDHPFPRPNVHERVSRALSKMKPDLVVACYGMNDGIYYPFDDQRFATYQKGILTLIEKVRASGAKLVLLSPPPFDPLPQKKAGKLRPKNSEKFAWFGIYENYDTEVMSRYAQWILDQKNRVNMVIDLRTPILAHVEASRKTNPDYALSGDGVHLNDEGNRIIAEAILQAWDYTKPAKATPALLKHVTQKQTLMRDAWLREVGHQRPGMKAGLPLADAQAKEKALNLKILEASQP